jgi:hypothetical protein
MEGRQHKYIIAGVNNCPTRCDLVQFLFPANWSTCFGWYLHLSSGARVNCNYSIWYRSNCILPSAVMQESGLRALTAEGSIHFDQCRILQLEFTRASDDVWRCHPKYVQQFAGNKNCTKSHLVGQLLTFIHDARTHEHKIISGIFFCDKFQTQGHLQAKIL